MLYLASILVTVLLYVMVFRTKTLMNVKFSRGQKIGCVLAAVMPAWVCISNLRIPFLYYWDYSCYYNMQLGLENNFSASAVEGTKTFFVALMQDDYTPLINLFDEWAFALSNKTANAFVACNFIIAVLPMLILVATLLVYLSSKVELRHKKAFWALGMSLWFSFPLLYAAASKGQPDFFGLNWILLILLLTIDYRFETWQSERLLYIFVAVVMLILTRRWYMYWLVGYLACYAVLELLWLIGRYRSHQVWKKPLCNAICYLVLCAGVGMLALHKLIFRILAYDYTEHYASYLDGGLGQELQSQVWHYGLLYVVVIAAGLIYGTYKTELRGLTWSSVGTFGIAIFLFTRVQNMDVHQSLLLLTPAMTLVFVGIMGLCSLRRKTVFGVSSAVLLAGSLAQGMSQHVNGSVPYLFSDAQVYREERNDFADVQKVADWIRVHIGENEMAYMIPHGNPYNPDVFRSIDLPDTYVRDHLYYGSAVLGTHEFPEGLLTAKYVITSDPLCDIGLAKKYNDAFLNGPARTKFELVETMYFENGYTFYFYERSQPYDREEIAYYRNLTAEENEKFPELYGAVLDRLEKELEA